MTASTRDQICKDISQFYEFCASKNHDLDEILGGGRYLELKTLLEQFYIYILNSQQLSIRRGGDIWKACKAFSIAIFDKTNPHIGALNSAESDWDFEKIKYLYAQLRAPKRLNNTSIRALSENAVASILEIISPLSEKNPFRTRNQLRNQILVLLMLTLGLRTSECLALTGSSLVLDDDIAWLKITYFSENSADPRAEKASIKNDHSHRIVPLPQFLYVLLNDYLSVYRRTNKKNNFLFTSNQGKPLTARQLRYIVETIGETINLHDKSVLFENFRCEKLSPHDFRHTAACNLLSHFYKESKEDMETALNKLREFMGWAPESDMPLRYARLYLQDASSRAAIKSIDLRFGVQK